MIRVVIFSFDRAMQLDLLLQSIEEFDIRRVFSVNVLFTCSTDTYQIAYDGLKNKYPHIQWVQEHRYEKHKINYQFNFGYWHNLYWWMKSALFRVNKSNFKSCLSEVLSAGNKYPFTMFLTDDSIFYNEIFIPEACLEKIKQQPEKYSFSFRHGLNLQGGIFREKADYIVWNVYENDAQTDWGYPFSVDGHVYGSSTIYRIIHKILLTNPNTMEGNIAGYATEKKIFPLIMASKQSCLAGFELNRVQSVSNNHHWDISQEKLNRYYLDGFSLEIGFNSKNVKYFRPEIQSLAVIKENEKINLWNQ